MNSNIPALDITVKPIIMTRKYKELPKKYVKIAKNNPTDLKLNYAAWSFPHESGNFIYYVYMSFVQGVSDRVYRFTKGEHEKLMKEYGIDEVRGLDKSWLSDWCEPYIICEPNL